MQAVPETAGIRNETGNRRAERNTALLNRGDGRRSDVLLAVFRASHDALSDKSPADTDTNADQKDRQQLGRNRPGRHQQSKPE